MLLILVFALYLSSSNINAQLSVDFYKAKCPNVETIIWEEVAKGFIRDNGIAPGLIRMHFHDCFVRGCDASILIKSTPGNSAEEDSPANASLRGFEVIESAKARLEQQSDCKGVVSCADILSYAARDSVVITGLTGGLCWDVPAGRRDGRISRAEDTIDIPGPSNNLNQNTLAFAKKKLTQDEMIALSGAHTIGRSHCTAFSNRLYNFSSTTRQDPTLDPLYAIGLKLQCPKGPQGTIDPNKVVPMNFSPTLFENSYYLDVLNNRGLFTSDQTLTTTKNSLSEVQEYARSNQQWLQDFTQAMIKMSQIEVITGTSGEIRSNCRAINPRKKAT